MVYGELGITPVSVDIKNRIVAFWARLIENKNNAVNNTLKLSTRVYTMIYNLHTNRNLRSQWLDNTMHLLNSSGYPGIWDTQQFVHYKWLITTFKQKSKDIFIQTWNAEINRTSNSNLYKFIHTSFCQRKYIRILNPFYCRVFLSFITRNHRLPIETGRWRSIPVNERKCELCNDLGDEYHYILICPQFTIHRKKYIKEYYYKRPNMVRFLELIDTNNNSEIKNLAILMNIVMNVIKT